MSHEEDEREAKRKRQVKKMTKILSKSWQLDHSEPFQEVTDDQLKMMGEGPFDLTGMGISLDNGTYHLGRKGWELFASHLGGIYNRFIAWCVLVNVKGFIWYTLYTPSYIFSLIIL
jgi:hypothetical protein